MSWQWIVLPGLAAALVTMGITPLAIRLAYRVRAIDVPGGRKRHQQDTPRLGGIAIVAGIVLVLGVSLTLGVPNSLATLSLEESVGFGFAALLIFCLGLADDIFGMRMIYKLAVQIMAASVIVFMGWHFDTVRLPVEGAFHLGILGPILSLFWIVGVTNAINLIDGLDGLAAGVVAIIGSSLLILAVLQESPETVVVTSCIVGACLGFLRHNWCPARIFMGDSGSLILGFLLATISLRSTPSVKASAGLAILVPLLALGLPVIDTLLVMWYRFLRGHRKMNRVARMFHADRAHLHHLLMDSQPERRRVMAILYGMATLFCGMAILVAARESWLLGLGFLLVEIVAVVVVRQVGLNAEARKVADQRIDLLRDAADPSWAEESTDDLENLEVLSSPPRAKFKGVKGNSNPPVRIRA